MPPNDSGISLGSGHGCMGRRRIDKHACVPAYHGMAGQVLVHMHRDKDDSGTDRQW